MEDFEELNEFYKDDPELLKFLKAIGEGVILKEYNLAKMREDLMFLYIRLSKKLGSRKISQALNDKEMYISHVSCNSKINRGYEIYKGLSPLIHLVSVAITDLKGKGSHVNRKV